MTAKCIWCGGCPEISICLGYVEDICKKCYQDWTPARTQVYMAIHHPEWTLFK